MKTEDKTGVLYTECHNLCAVKTGYSACGDYFEIFRDAQAVTAVLADGLGSGIKASVASAMSCASVMRMIKAGFSVKEAAGTVIKTARRAKETQNAVYAAFTVVRILNDGTASVLTYDAPGPVLITNKQAYVPKMKFTLTQGQVTGELNIRLKEGDGLLVMTDGITQAGMGRELPFGWTEEGVREFVNANHALGFTEKDIPQLLINRASALSGGYLHDDASAAYFSCRKGRVMNIITGPPSARENDAAAAREFMRADGIKIICGSTTADIISRETGINVGFTKTYSGFFRPPKYIMKGIEVVTEGAVVLNQLYNIIDLEGIKLDKESCVTEIAVLARVCDVINIYLGKAENPGHDDIAFTQLGILPRAVIINMLAEKLRKMGKLVVIKEV
ncbi:MAG TPA: SpoIIE family protein phosphatase [Candidatus Goldiibacteriota bacterium]|nr:SpoIIE family protein phosphatase [Candidatus Goldiibacteriota bacterium]HRQ43462.1 SpoIIE family protein phosphatase [Candidatus Goldiibacteriota bacterium]